MNRRDFLKRGALAAAVPTVAISATKELVDSDFPETEDQMHALVEECKKSGNYKFRVESGLIPEGMSKTVTFSSIFWYYHKGNRIAVLHVRHIDNHVCFSIERIDSEKPTFFSPPRPQQWARNKKYEEEALREVIAREANG